MLSVSQGLTAHGHGEVKAKPDIARLTAGVVTQAKDQAQATPGQRPQDDRRCWRPCKGLKIADRDIQTQGYSVEPQYDYGAGHAPILTGYQVSNSRPGDGAGSVPGGTVIDKATQAGANQVNGVSYDLSDRAAVAGAGAAQAVADARRRAAGDGGCAGDRAGQPAVAERRRGGDARAADLPDAERWRWPLGCGPGDADSARRSR